MEDIASQIPLLIKGSEKAFSTIYNHYWDRLYYVAYQKLQSQEAAEEIVQEVFLTLWRDRQKLSIHSLSNYLAAMVRHAVYRYVASEKAVKNRELRFEEVQKKNLNLEDELNNKLALKKILELSNQLPLKCRLVFQRNKLQDEAIKDVAKELNISIKTAEAHLSKALKFIRLNIRSFLCLFF
ncbi:sigma-70 family RNA polymerase sigma factor [Sphingobacterium chuzhouense]|uniref:Sigma-70 family RNA polymerase sigma factor n=1 Tax=Sphingobacterium chuzhouense TaxID=1742264 RepID=A0ABR7XXY2_9SPHI|nr:sigma-70 family RNA polymerase sigma factor [Sphingobacterium chuzhouense]MBD1423919.1 sigma-70 family RNA polymerase sigma factor [Sphingobacterium chuzhouense]